MTTIEPRVITLNIYHSKNRPPFQGIYFSGIGYNLNGRKTCHNEKKFFNSSVLVRLSYKKYMAVTTSHNEN